MKCTCAPLAATTETGTQTTTVASFGMAGLENSSLLRQLDGMGRQMHCVNMALTQSLMTTTKSLRNVTIGTSRSSQWCLHGSKKDGTSTRPGQLLLKLWKPSCGLKG